VSLALLELRSRLQSIATHQTPGAAIFPNRLGNAYTSAAGRLRVDVADADPGGGRRRRDLGALPFHYLRAYYTT
jgi:hypothetical protein